MTKPDALERLRKLIDEVPHWGQVSLAISACAEVLDEAKEVNMRLAQQQTGEGREQRVARFHSRAAEADLQATRLRSVVGGER